MIGEWRGWGIYISLWGEKYGVGLIRNERGTGSRHELN